MWPFKKKQKRWRPKSDFDYWMLGVVHGIEFRQALRDHEDKRPKYTPSKIITQPV